MAIAGTLRVCRRDCFETSIIFCSIQWHHWIFWVIGPKGQSSLLCTQDLLRGPHTKLQLKTDWSSTLRYICCVQGLLYCIFIFFKILFIYLRENTQAGRAGEGETDSPLSREPDVGSIP